MKKAAFLLLAAAWLTGSAHGHGPSTSCCPTAPSCEPVCCEKPGLLDRLRGMFGRNDCCAPTCEVHCAPACPTPCPAPCPTTCDTGHRGLLHRSDCQPSCAPACPTTSCDTGCGRPSLLDKLRARFRRDNCDSCCDPCGTVAHGGAGLGAPVYGAPGGPIVTPKTGETITTPPKKLPPAGSKTSARPPAGEVRIISPSAVPFAAPPAINTVPAAPALDNRSPF